MAFPIVTVPYVSRVLGAHNIGIVNFVTTYANYFTLFALLGIPIYGIREISKVRNSLSDTGRAFSEIFSVSLISTALVTIVYFLTIFLVPSLREQWLYLVIAGGTLYLCCFSVDWFYIGREKLKAVAVRSLIVKGLCLIGMFLFVKSREDAIYYLLVIVFSTVASNIWNVAYLVNHGVKINFVFGREVIKRHIRPLLVLFLSSVTISIYTMLDTLLLGFVSDYSQVGYYTSAMKISKMLITVVVTAGGLLMSRISFHHSEKNMEEIGKLIKKSFELVVAVAVPLVVIQLVSAARFVPFFFGTDFLPAIVPMMMLSSLIVICGLSNPFGMQLMLGTEHDRQYLVALAIGMVLSIVSNLLLAPRFGAIGSSMAAVIAELSVTVSVIWFSTKIIRIKIEWREILTTVVATIPMVVCALLLSWRYSALTNFEYLVILGILGFGSYVALQYFVFRNRSIREIVGTFASKIQRK